MDLKESLLEISETGLAKKYQTYAKKQINQSNNKMLVPHSSLNDLDQKKVHTSPNGTFVVHDSPSPVADDE